MTHTPGPWTIRESVTKPERDFAIMANGGIIAEVFERGGRSHQTHVEVEANAKLIAAAPALLEALETAKSALSGTPCSCNDDRDCQRCHANRQARAAIKAAKGDA